MVYQWLAGCIQGLRYEVSKHSEICFQSPTQSLMPLSRAHVFWHLFHNPRCLSPFKWISLSVVSIMFPLEASFLKDLWPCSMRILTSAVVSARSPGLIMDILCCINTWSKHMTYLLLNFFHMCILLLVVFFLFLQLVNARYCIMTQQQKILASAADVKIITGWDNTITSAGRTRPPRSPL